MEPQGQGLYKHRRIHISRLVFGVYVASVVHPGPNGAVVEVVAGKHQTREEALTAAIAHIDQHDATGLA